MMHLIHAQPAPEAEASAWEAYARMARIHAAIASAESVTDADKAWAESEVDRLHVLFLKTYRMSGGA